VQSGPLDVKGAKVCFDDEVKGMTWPLSCQPHEALGPVITRGERSIPSVSVFSSPLTLSHNRSRKCHRTNFEPRVLQQQYTCAAISLPVVIITSLIINYPKNQDSNHQLRLPISKHPKAYVV
jgi:hypothetical protein